MKITKSAAVELGRVAFDFYYNNCLKLDVCAKSLLSHPTIKEELTASEKAHNYLSSNAGMDSFINASVEYCQISGKADITIMDIISYIAQKGTTKDYVIRVRT